MSDLKHARLLRRLACIATACIATTALVGGGAAHADESVPATASPTRAQGRSRPGLDVTLNVPKRVLLLNPHYKVRTDFWYKLDCWSPGPEGEWQSVGVGGDLNLVSTSGAVQVLKLAWRPLGVGPGTPATPFSRCSVTLTTPTGTIATNTSIGYKSGWFGATLVGTWDLGANVPRG